MPVPFFVRKASVRSDWPDSHVNVCIDASRSKCVGTAPLHAPVRAYYALAHRSRSTKRQCANCSGEGRA